MYSLWFLTATWTAGAAAEPPAGAVYAPAQGQAAVLSSPLASEPPSLRERVRNLFGRPAEKVYTYPCSTCTQALRPAPMVASPYAPAPPAPVAPVTTVTHRPTLSFHKAPEDNIGHEHDY